MKALIVYYSLEGNTAYAAERIANIIGADMLRLVPKKAYSDKGFTKFLWGGKSAVMGEQPELESYDADPYIYDVIIFGFPVWASRFAPPLRTFVDQHLSVIKGKKLYAFACQAGTGGQKALTRLSELIGRDFECTEIFIDPKQKRSDKTDAAIDAFAQRIRSDIEI